MNYANSKPSVIYKLAKSLYAIKLSSYDKLIFGEIFH